jgi:hypothetical protein
MFRGHQSSVNQMYKIYWITLDASLYRIHSCIHVQTIPRYVFGIMDPKIVSFNTKVKQVFSKYIEDCLIIKYIFCWRFRHF